MGLRAASVRHPNGVMAPALTEAGQSQNFALPPSSPINSLAQNGGYAARADLRGKCAYAGLEVDAVGAGDGDGHGHDAVSDVASGMSRDVEQLLSNLADVGGAGDLGQNVDDLMQVMKTMEAGAAEREPEIMFPIAFDRELFSEVDMMTMCEEESLAPAHSKELRAQEMLDDLLKRQAKLERRSEFLLRRLRKIQARTMGRHAADEVAGLYEHVHRALQRFKTADPLTTTTPDGPTIVTTTTTATTITTTTDATASVSVAMAVKPLGVYAMSNLVRKLHMSALQQSATSGRKHASKYFGAGSVEVSGAGAGASRSSASVATVRLPTEARDELERVSGTLHTQLSILETQVDSDATASSSGAESCDEMQTYNNQHQHFLSISKRAAWRYANERAAVAARWTWLQAQISDLEYRIRQHNELHRQIRACKGAVILGEPRSASTTTSTPTPASPNASAVNGYRGQLPGATTPTIKSGDDLANGTSFGLNSGFSSGSNSGVNSGINSGASTPSSLGSNNGGAGGSARTRPLHRATFRKRKLLQTTGLHTVSKKANRPANIRCGCVPPVVPCALCTGRIDPTFPRDVPEQLTVPERIALLDPGYHPVLSFPDDISQGIHLDAIMKLSDWQQKTLRCNMKSLKGLTKADRTEKMATGLDSRPKKSSEHRKKYNNRLLKSSAANALSTKIKSKLNRGRRPLSRGATSGGSGNKKRHTAKMAMAQLHALASESMDEMEMEALGASLGGPGSSSSTLNTNTRGGGGGTTTTSESLTPSPLSHVQVVPYRRNRVDSYDIDNIVIPYSVAASTRVEKLQYKEILTPKWRVIDNDFPAKYDVKNNGIVRRVSQDSDMEDVSDETIIVRHDKCEHDEKKKFLSYIKFPLSVGRSRANRRTDSRAESSGANTPDPMSPHTGDNSEAISSPLTSPPATPVSMLTNDDSSTINTNPFSTTATASTPLISCTSTHGSLRRRTVSQSKWATLNRVEETRCVTPEYLEVVPPYEPRVFPLPEDVYDSMLKFMPDGHPPAVFIKQSSRESEAPLSPIGDSRAVSPVESDSTESAIADEDPNDPEWMDVERVRDRNKR